MISAQVDSVLQENLIEKYMLLPNQVWDDIIGQAAKVIHNFFSMSFMKLKKEAYVRMHNVEI